MPEYQFNCCMTLTVTSSMSDLVTPTCPKCNKLMARDYNFASVTFKGSGFYSKDKNDN